jgi:hypothetical protein
MVRGGHAEERHEDGIAHAEVHVGQEVERMPSRITRTTARSPSCRLTRRGVPKRMRAR